MKILVTGGSGFIGSHVVDALVARGNDVRILDRNPSRYHDGEVEMVVGDVTRLDDVRRAIAGCDAVIHLAARADVDDVKADPLGSEEVNAQGTLAVLEAARAAGVRRVVYASTIWIYDAHRNGHVVDEDTPIGIPRHFYTATKLAGEMYCSSYGELYGLPFTILRFGIPYGPRARPAAVLPTFVQKALHAEPIEIAGTGEQSRRFVYVEDLADGVATAALAPAAENRIYNLVGDESVTVLEIAQLVQQIVRPVEIVHREGRAGDFAGVEVSGERAARELGWRPLTRFADGARRYVDWLTSNGA